MFSVRIAVTTPVTFLNANIIAFGVSLKNAGKLAARALFPFLVTVAFVIAQCPASQHAAFVGCPRA